MCFMTSVRRTPQANSSFAELHRLKAAGRVEIIAELIEILRRHRFEHVDLLFEEPLDRMDALEMFADPQQLVGSIAPTVRIEFVQDLLEP